MKIFNVRLGLATNSSSSHSIVIIPGGHKDYDADGEYGWNCFTLGSRGAKNDYLATMFRDVITSMTTYDIADAIVNSVFETEVGEDNYVDHNSVFGLPREYNSTMPSIQFMKALREFVINNHDIVILGGNDNDGEHPLSCEYPELDLPTHELEFERGNLICRHDTTYDFWTLFNQKSGGRVMFRFSIDDIRPSIDRASIPMLVDLKITDYCPFGCEFCYQNSTLEGKHADYSDIYDVLHRLSVMEVFEVAIGGGEPTLHPQFVDILKVARGYGIVPNFTTRSLKWLSNYDTAKEIMQYAGGVAYSAHSEDGVYHFCDMMKQHSWHRTASIHIVLGTVSQEQFKRYLTIAYEAGVGVTLLGYKEDGRGKTFTPQNYDWWLSTYAAMEHAPRLSIDTALAKTWQDKLEAADIPSWMYQITEGTFSMYIDAVAKTCAKSSYGDSEMVAYDSPYKIEGIWQKWQTR